MKYEQQLRQPEWLLKRKEILFRDNHKCKKCFSTKNLRVHHIKYINSLMAWEYSNDMLITLCEKCHNDIHNISEFQKIFEMFDIPENNFQESLFGEMTEIVIVEPNE